MMLGNAIVDPRPGASARHWRSWVRDLIRAGRFRPRFFSWVCVHGRYFLKIPRVHGQVETDFHDGAPEAEREYRLSRRLSERLDGMVNAPLRLVDGCIVAPRLSGSDLWILAKREGGTARVRAAIAQGVIMAAKLHCLDPAAIPRIVAYDYANDRHLPLPRSLCDRLGDRPRTIVLGGLEVRNFRQVCADGPWMFFDPHEAILGAPEDDVARYVLSLLMISWGRHAHCRIWTSFDYPQLIQTYEATRGALLDRQLLVYMFRRNIAQRCYQVRRTTRDLPWFMRVAARTYEALFFRQAREWGGRHGL